MEIPAKKKSDQATRVTNNCNSIAAHEYFIKALKVVDMQSPDNIFYLLIRLLMFSYIYVSGVITK